MAGHGRAAADGGPLRDSLLVVVAGVVLLGAAGTQDVIRSNVERLRAWVDVYEEQLPSIVADERYEQRLVRTRSGLSDRFSTGVASRDTERTRVLVSEFMLVKPAAGFEWIPYRDVFSVDGQPVRDRSDRLAKLLLDPTASSFDAAERIANESTRYNLGNLVRTVNVPTLVLAFLGSRNAACCTVRDHGLASIEGKKLVHISFDETAVPGIVSSQGGFRVRSKGDVWVDADGSLRRSRLIMTVGGTRAEIRVDWEPHRTLGMVVPTEMRESYNYGGREIEGVATYSNIRKFGVSTEEVIR
jgi:hypothetical protein